ncbi:MAG TPA: efflux RND transporter periplasmic adaptor subunit [Bacteroidota bacterium]|nr:efflux RND transporter periplasmic adaptor subunit [Bacteroidota bacterium]
MKYNVLIAFLPVLLLLAGSCNKTTEEEAIDYPERTHTDEQTTLVMTRHQLDHIQFATERAEEKSVSVPLSLPARIALNERETAHITARVSGRVEKVHRVAGDRVRKGDVLLELFSQEFLAMQSEFISAEERFKRVSENDPDHGTAKAIYESARKKLEIVGLTVVEIEGLADNHNPLTLLPVRAPFDGALLKGEVRLGEFVQLGTEFFTLANLSRLWVIADVFEHDLPLISEGLAGEVSVTPYPTELFRATLTTIYDMIDERSRTVKTRFEVENRAGKLKPEMFATVNVHARFGGKTLKVPSSAVMENRGSAYVFVALNDTTFEQRVIQTGFETKTYTEILQGLKPGEVVVTKGIFYLKSELAKSSFVEEE